MANVNTDEASTPRYLFLLLLNAIVVATCIPLVLDVDSTIDFVGLVLLYGHLGSAGIWLARHRGSSPLVIASALWISALILICRVFAVGEEPGFVTGIIWVTVLTTMLVASALEFVAWVRWRSTRPQFRLANIFAWAFVVAVAAASVRYKTQVNLAQQPDIVGFARLATICGLVAHGPAICTLKLVIGAGRGPASFWAVIVQVLILIVLLSGLGEGPFALFMTLSSVLFVANAWLMDWPRTAKSSSDRATSVERSASEQAA